MVFRNFEKLSWFENDLKEALLVELLVVRNAAIGLSGTKKNFQNFKKLVIDSDPTTPKNL